MNMDFVDFNLAKKLKEKGFREECFARYNCSDKAYFCINSYHPNPESILYCYNNDEDLGRFYIDAPTISQVLKWLRKEKELHIRVSVYFIGWCVDVTNMDGKRMYSTECEYNSFEQAAIAGIEYVINNLI